MGISYSHLVFILGRIDPNDYLSFYKLTLFKNRLFMRIHHCSPVLVSGFSLIPHQAARLILNQSAKGNIDIVRRRLEQMDKPRANRDTPRRPYGIKEGGEFNELSNA